MKRLVIAFMALAAVAPPAASAHEKSARLVPVVVRGEDTTSRSASGGCGFVAGARSDDDLLMRCGRAAGSAVAKYDFSLPSSFVGEPAFAVSSTRLSCSHCSIRTRLTHVGERHYRVTVTVSGQAQLDVQSVRFSYYAR